VLFLTRWFGVTGSEAERNLGAEQTYTDEIVEKILLMQANAAAKQQRALARGTHAKGVTAQAQFEVLDVTVGRDGALAARLAKGIFARHLSRDCPVCQFRPAGKFRLQGGCPIAVLLRRPHSRRDCCSTSRCRATGLLAAKRNNSADKRRASIPGDDEAAYGLEPSKRPMVANAPGQIEGAENARIGAITGTSATQALSATSLLEHRPVPSRAGGRGEAVGYPLSRQSRASSAKKQFRRPAG
jgi:hypothetical protein